MAKDGKGSSNENTGASAKMGDIHTAAKSTADAVSYEKGYPELNSGYMGNSGRGAVKGKG